jgi:hypothetical protein
MKLWIDDLRLAPEGYTWCKSVEEAKMEILKMEQQQKTQLLLRRHCQH